jgi:hypothetical protein
MPQQVNFEGTTHEFPDDFSPSEIQSALASLPKPTKSVGGFVQNVGTSAGRMAEGVGQMIAHPIDTLGNMAAIGVGGIQRVFPTFTSGVAPEKRAEADRTFQGAVDVYKNRYGSPQKIADTLYTDPVGAAADVSTVLGGAGMAAKAANFPRVARAAELASAATNPLAPVSKAVGAVGNRVAEVTAPGRQSAAEWLAIKSLKPDVNSTPEQRAALAQTQIREKLPTSVKGYQQGSTLLNQLSTKLDGIISDLDAHGAKVDVDVARAQLAKVRDSFETVDPARNQARVNAMDRRVGKSVGTFEERMVPTPSESGLVDASDNPVMIDKPEQVRVSGDIPISEAQARKQKTYRVLNKSYGEQRAVDVESLKALARGLKQEIENSAAKLEGTVPGAEDVSSLNKREADIIKLQKAMLPKITQAASSNPIPSGPLFAGRVVGSATGMPVLGAAAGGFRELVSIPSMASKAAIRLAPGSGPTAMGNAVRNFPRITPLTRVPPLFPHWDE